MPPTSASLRSGSPADHWRIVHSLYEPSVAWCQDRCAGQPVRQCVAVVASMSEVVEDQRPAVSYIPGRSREHRDYAGDPTETIAS